MERKREKENERTKEGVAREVRKKGKKDELKVEGRK